MKKIYILFICGSLFLSCKPVSKSIEDTLNVQGTLVQHKDHRKEHTVTTTAQHTEEEKNGFLNDTDRLLSAEAALKRLPEYAGKEIFIYLFLGFYDNGTINVMLQHPENPEYVDVYDYRNGQWSVPVPKQLSVNDDIQHSLISLNKVSFASVAQVNKIYREKASRIEGAKPLTNIYITVVNNAIDWYPMNIEGSRERYAIRFNTDGTLKAFKQD
ncbi:hypothetical protein [Pedobacter cryoconitis]|uniref:Uncharacterized protein n=1 Tax=Pedobacter cryoconitis TaxID=188932 RepID=A0A327T2A1_9SPHI|nr:hypothetical protein [Pedobacter cryoconitis]RAJ35770.1 hypothetical protein LY11_01017 [Pedobacter cryoconitis]